MLQQAERPDSIASGTGQASSYTRLSGSILINAHGACQRASPTRFWKPCHNETSKDGCGLARGLLDYWLVQILREREATSSFPSSSLTGSNRLVSIVSVVPGVMCTRK